MTLKKEVKIMHCQLCDKTLTLLDEDVCDYCNSFIHDLGYKSIKIKGAENKLKQQVKSQTS